MSSQEETTLCPNCDQNIEKSKFFLHERMCSQNVKKCPKCNKPYNIDDLNDHIKLFHSYTICDLCSIKFPNSEIEEHKKNCLCQLIPCKFCELNVLLKELEEHEEICGSTTQQCSTCGLYIEKRNFPNHICFNKETEYFNENIKIDNEKDVKKEKRMIKHGLEKNTYKKNKAKINIINTGNDINDQNKKEEKNKKFNKNEIEDDYIFYENKGNKNKKKGGGKKNKIKKDENINIDNNDNKNIDDNNIDLKDFYTPQEIKNQIKAFNRFEKINYINNNDENENDKDNNKHKKKNKKNKNKEKEKEDEKEVNEKPNEIKSKKGKKFKNLKNIKINKNEDNKYFDEEENYIGNKNLDLHNIKWDIPPDRFKNYNKVKTYDYRLDYNLEENLLQEAIQLSLLEK